MYALATNPNTASGDLDVLYLDCVGSHIYKHIVRSLLANKNFDPEIAKPDDLTYDPLCLKYLQRRMSPRTKISATE